MKKKKAFIGLVMVGMLVAVGGISLFLLEYFSSGAGRSNAGGDLSIDYFVSEKELDEEESDGAGSQNIFQWLAEKLSSDKNKGGDEPAVDPADPSDLTQSGVSQNIRRPEDGEDDEEALALPSDTPQNDLKPNDKKKPDDGEEEDGDIQQEAPSEDQTQKDNSNQDQEEEKDDSKRLVTISIRCDTAVAKGMNLESKWAGIVPSSGSILPVTTVEYQEGDTVFDVLCRVRDTYKIHVSYRGTNGAQYIDGINNLYEFDGGRWSGWMYSVNDWYPNYGCGQYMVKNGDVIVWSYTCNLGRDLGQDWMASDEWMDANE